MGNVEIIANGYLGNINGSPQLSLIDDGVITPLITAVTSRG